jgi:signal transduction histidine kinase/FixJ family two-component response regulator
VSASTDDRPTISDAATGLSELGDLQPTLARLARIAKSLFDVPAADVTMFVDGAIWRASGDDTFESDPASEAVNQGDDLLWVEDLTTDQRFCGHPSVTGDLALRFYAGAPIRLEHGERVGVIGVFGQTPRAYDKVRAARLMELAELAAHEFSRARALRERDQTLERLAHSEQRLEIALARAGLFVYEMDYVNKRLFKAGNELTFYEEPIAYRDLTGGPLETIHPEDRDRAMEMWNRRGEPGARERSEFRVARNDGKEVWAQFTAKVIEDAAGRPTRLIGTLQDITDRKRAEAAMTEAKLNAEAANHAKSVFLATMSHEIRTPLNGVLGMAQAMAADALEPVQRDRLDVIRQSGEALLAILNDILDLSKIEAGKLELEEIDLDLGDIARGAHAAFTALANKKGLSFALDIDAAQGVYRGDPTRLRQILYNLISNALKFTEQGEIRVTASYDGAELRLQVCDTGMGMSAEVVDGLFEKFNQAHASTTRRFGGTGLGLSICRELAELMGGSIEVESAIGQGATFTVTLPLPRVGAGRMKAAPSQTEPPQAEARTMPLRILAAEDNSINQLVLKTLLHQIGVDPLVVENGQLAVEAWEANQFDVILMDVQMPVMDGPAAARAIRQREAESGRARTPIIALTANAMSHQTAEYIAAGMDAWVTKPIEVSKLFEALDGAINAAERSSCERPQPNRAVMAAAASKP